MGTPSFRSLAEKADLAVSNLTTDGGYLNTIQANTFIRMIQEPATLMKLVRMVPMNGPRMEINKIGFATRILKAGPATNTALAAADRSSPTTDKVELLTSPVRAEVHIPYDVLEDNIEQGNLEDTIMSMITERAALDLEELLILGDTTTVGDDFLALQDGILALATTNVVDYTAAPVSSIDKDIFRDAKRAMPNKYLRNQAQMRFFFSPNVETEHAYWLAGRETSYGDSRLTLDYVGQLTPFGIPLYPVALMPDDKGIFTFPKNFIAGVQRQIMIETDRDIRSQVIIIVVSMRVAFAFEEEEAVVKVDGLNP
jgi:HK97 family phage major capsid protein